MIDETEDDSQSPYTQGFGTVSGPPSLGSHALSDFAPTPGNSDIYGNANNLLGQFEPMLDADPFGLSASMHFHTPFSYEQSNAGRR